MSSFPRLGLVLLGLAPLLVLGQVPLSLGPYHQNFNSLATSGTANPWENNVTLSGWYLSRNNTNAATYRAGDGSNNTGDLWSFGTAGVGPLNDRALGALASGSTATIHFGLRFTNDTAATFTNFVVTYTGEQWRNGSNSQPQSLAFSYRVAAAPLTNPALPTGWISHPALDFVSPQPLTSAASALDGNAATNRQTLDIFVAGLSVAPGEELFLRWTDLNDVGNDHALAMDDLTVLCNVGFELPPAAPDILTQPQSQVVAVGETATFTVAATGNPPPAYQWQWFGTNLPGASANALLLPNLTTNQSGPYRVVVSNRVGTVTSAVAVLTVYSPSTVSVLTYNVKGNGATDWSTNSLQVQAIARQLQFLQPDVITFNEIPWDLRYEMTNFAAVFLPGYQLAVSSGTDGSICSAIASRHPITRASKWLDGIDLRSFGYSNANNALDNFTRDLFEAQISVPGFTRPLHVFTTHLKATASAAEYADNALKRAAEATAITNFFATNLFALYPYDLYVLTGDMNASDTNELCIQKLISPATGLTLTDPKNPVTGSINTYSTTTANPGSRLDYIFPGPLLYANIRTSQVFRTDRLTPVPPNLNSNDCKVASDHLPVLMVFNNPYDQPFQFLSVARTNTMVTLNWESVFGQTYRVETSTNLTLWTTQANNVLATNSVHTFSTNLPEAQRFFRVRRVP